MDEITELSFFSSFLRFVVTKTPFNTSKIMSSRGHLFRNFHREADNM
jgi:hypothetical protein